MITDIEINKPKPIFLKKEQEELVLFNSSADNKLAILALEEGKFVLITEVYSNGLLLLNALHTHLKTKFANKSFKEQRNYRTEYYKLSNLILIKIVAHQLEVKNRL